MFLKTNRVDSKIRYKQVEGLLQGANAKEEKKVSNSLTIYYKIEVMGHMRL